MNKSTADRDPIEMLADSFLARYRRGERPSVEDYAAQRPEQADEIRELLPALVMLEQEKPSAGADTAANGGTAGKAAGATPRQLGDYVILREIARGGMGVVYEATQQSLGRHVALKVLPHNRLAEPTQLARFKHEARAAAMLHHTNIVPVFGVGEHEGVHYYAMQYIQGQSLDAVLREVKRLRGGTPALPACSSGRDPTLAKSVAAELVSGQFARKSEPPAQTEFLGTSRPTDQAKICSAMDLGAIPGSSSPSSSILGRSGSSYYRSVARIGVQAAEALAYAHHQKVLHRDIKPSNLLLDLQGTVWVTDFGLAKAEGTDALTHTGDIVGTLRYMAPERFRGEADARSDVYALGLTLYELLTLEPAFPAEQRPRLIEQILHDDPPRPRQHDPLIPRDLETVVQKAMAKEPSDRYRTASELAEDLRRYLADRPILARRPTLLDRAGKWVRRRPGIAASAVAALVLAVAGLAVSNGLVRREMHAKEIALAAAQRSERDAKDSLWRSLYVQARARRFSGQVGQRLSRLDALAQAAQLRSDERLRDEAIAAMALPDVRLGPTWNTWPPGYDAWNVDGDYRLVARSNEKGLISIRSLEDDREIQNIVSAPTRRGVVLLSPDGRYVPHLEAGDTLKVWRVADRTPVLRQAPPRTQGWAFTSDSRHLAIGQQGCIVRFDLETGLELNRWPLPEARRANALAFSPDDQLVAVGYLNSSFASVHNAQSGKLVARFPVGPIVRQVVAWHPDGERLAVAGSDPRIQIWNVPAASKIATLEGHLQEVMILDFHPGGSLLVSNSWDGTARLWDPATGRQLLHFSGTARCDFSRDGRWLGLARNGEQTQLLEVAPTREFRTLSFGAGSRVGNEASEHDISPDGRILAQTVDDTVRLFHLATGRELAVLPPGRPVFQSNRELLIAGEGGLACWPIQPVPAAGELRIGPPRTVALPALPSRAARTADGRMLAIVCERAGGIGLLVDLATHSVRPERFDHPAGGFIVLSPDGRWLATGGWHSDYVRLWAVATHTMVKEWRLRQARAYFTPDSRGLIISDGGEFRIWDVATLQLIRRIPREVPGYPGYVAFSPDGRLMALEMATGIIHLKDAAAARTVARLEDPHGDAAGWISFTPDGTQLVVTAVLARGVHIWDLRLIRQRLLEMGLDWDAPPYPPADPECEANHLLKITVLPGDRARPEQLREQKARQDIERYRLALDAQPDSPKNCNNLAWAYLTAPKALRDVKAALPLAEKAVRIVPGNAVCGNTLGVAYYRAGQYQKAIDVLRPNLDRQEDRGLAYDLFFLAMSHHRLGETARARDYYDWAVRWIGAQGGPSAEYEDDLKMFRAEAEEVLRIDNK
jgi:serine/threonine protein kinase/WD40 repeat protein